MESGRDHPHPKAMETPNELTYYWPISLLPITYKVFEKLHLKRLLPMVENNRLMPNHQFDFRQKHSEIEQRHCIVQRTNEVPDTNQYC
jgi:hypothetical protein